MKSNGSLRRSGKSFVGNKGKGGKGGKKRGLLSNTLKSLRCKGEGKERGKKRPITSFTAVVVS